MFDSAGKSCKNLNLEIVNCENNELKVTEELLQNIDAIVDLKLETENLLNEADAVIENCNEILSC